MADHDDAPPAGSWPDASLLPDPKASNREHAAWYRDVMGWIVLPMPSDADVMSHAMSLARKAVADYVEDHDEEPSEEIRQDLWDEARELAEAARKGPIGYIEQATRGKVSFAHDVTDAMLDLWFVPPEDTRGAGPRREAHKRGICIRPGRSASGFPAVVVDVDPRHGGEVDGPWGMGLSGPKASTPGGGVHTFMLASGKERNSGGALAPGVDVVATTPIAVPAGEVATPGRRWTAWSPLQPAPEALRKGSGAGKRKALARGQDAREREPGDDDEAMDGDPGRVALIIAHETGDSERNNGTEAIVGMLARAGACPPDFVTACLDLLVEYMAGRDSDSAAVRDEAARWRHALTRGPRDADFAAEVVIAWAVVRDTSRRPWSSAKAGKVARSIWKTCDLRSGGEAGAEDLGIGPPLAAALPGWTATPLIPATPLPPRPMPVAAAAVDTARERFIFDGPAPQGEAASGTETAGEETPQTGPAPPLSPAQVAAEAAKANARWRGGIDPRTYVLSLSEVYSDADLQADLEREPIQIGEVMPAVDFATGKYLVHSLDNLATPTFHGWGGDLNAALGGLKAGDFVVIGASGAGAGKTWFACWLANGLAMQTAWRLLGARGYDQAPIVLPIWVTEMMSKSDLYLRLAGAHLGFDVAAITRGRQAHEAPGIIAMAQKYSMTPMEVVRVARESERLHGTSEKSPMGFARHHVIKHVRLSKLPRRTRQAGVVVDHRSGPMLVDHLADAVDCYREDFASAAGVSTDKVFPLVIIDPTQRFVSGDSEKRAIDEFIGAAAHVLCNELDAAVIATSDTTKAAATDIRVADFLGMDPKALEARVLAGSYAIVHNATHCLMLQAEHPAEGGLRSRQWARITKNRSGGPSDVAFPFGWERHLGRYLPEAPHSLAEFAQAHEASQRGRGPGGRSRLGADHLPTGPTLGALPPGLRLPSLRKGYVSESERD